MKRRTWILAVGIILLVGGIFFVGLVRGRAGSEELSKEYKSKLDSTGTEESQISPEFKKSYWNFSAELLKKSAKENENTMISPVSVEIALAMTANGAVGETKSQMEAILGETDLSTINLYLKDFAEGLSTAEDGKIKLANSIWIKENDGLEVNPEFLQQNANYFNASVFKSGFGKQTVHDINKWVDTNSEGTIKQLLSKIEKNTQMILINTIFFNQKWEEPYDSTFNEKEVFTNNKGETEQADMMYSEESTYLEDEDSIGYMKPYQTGQYQLAVVLPKKENDFEHYFDSFTGEKFSDLIAGGVEATVNASLPKLETQTSLSLKEPLKKMSMKEPFDETNADFGEIALSENKQLYISDVIHKTYISFAEEGTKAGAATAVTVDTGSTPIPVEIKEVYLNRPYIYAIIDSRTSLPLFIGTVETVEK